MRESGLFRGKSSSIPSHMIHPNSSSLTFLHVYTGHIQTMHYSGFASDEFQSTLDEKLELLSQLSDDTARWLGDEDEDRYAASESDATGSSVTLPFEDGTLLLLSRSHLFSVPLTRPFISYPLQRKKTPTPARLGCTILPSSRRLVPLAALWP